jgi:hypothetical protein
VDRFDQCAIPVGPANLPILVVNTKLSSHSTSGLGNTIQQRAETVDESRDEQ